MKSDLKLLIARDGDAHALYEHINKSRDHLHVLTWARSITEKGLRDFITEKLWSLDTLLAIHLNNEPIGCIDLRVCDTHIDLGYWISVEHANRGYMKHALFMAFEQLNPGTIVKARVAAIFTN